MNEVIFLKNEKTGATVRAVIIDGIRWFLAKDVARFLDYCGSGSVTYYANEDEIRRINISDLDWENIHGNHNMVFVSESGIKRVILYTTKNGVEELKELLDNNNVTTNKKVYLDAPGSQELEVTTIDGKDYIDCRIIHKCNNYQIRYKEMFRLLKTPHIIFNEKEYYSVIDSISLITNRRGEKKIDLINNILNGGYIKENKIVIECTPKGYYYIVGNNKKVIANKIYLDAPGSDKLKIVKIDGNDCISLKSIYTANRFYKTFNYFTEIIESKYHVIYNSGKTYVTVAEAMLITFLKRSNRQHELIKNITNGDYVKENKINLSEFRIATKISSQKQRIDYDLENKTSESNEPKIITIQDDSYESIMLPKETNNSEIKELDSEEINSNSNSMLLQIAKENKSLFIADIQAKINKLQKTLEFIENLK